MIFYSNENKTHFTGKVLQEPYFESESFWNSENNGLLLSFWSENQQESEERKIMNITS